MKATPPKSLDDLFDTLPESVFMSVDATHLRAVPVVYTLTIDKKNYTLSVSGKSKSGKDTELKSFSGRDLYKVLDGMSNFIEQFEKDE